MRSRWRVGFLVLVTALSGVAQVHAQSGPADSSDGDHGRFRYGNAVFILQNLELGPDFLGSVYRPLIDGITKSKYFIQVTDEALQKSNGNLDRAAELLMKSHADIEVVQTACLRFAAYLLKEPSQNTDEAARPVDTAIRILNTLVRREGVEVFFRAKSELDERIFTDEEEKIIKSIQIRLAQKLVELSVPVIPAPYGEDIDALDWFDPTYLLDSLHQAKAPSEVLAHWMKLAETESKPGELLPSAKSYLHLLAGYLSVVFDDGDFYKDYATAITHHPWIPSAIQILFATKGNRNWVREYLNGIRGYSVEESETEQAHLFRLMSPVLRISHALQEDLSQDIIDGFLLYLEKSDHLKLTPIEPTDLKPWVIRELNEFFLSDESKTLAPGDLFDAAHSSLEKNPKWVKLLAHRANEFLALAKAHPGRPHFDRIDVELALYLSSEGTDFNLVDYVQLFAIPAMMNPMLDPEIPDDQVPYASFMEDLVAEFLREAQPNAERNTLALKFRELLDRTVVLAPENSYFFQYLGHALSDHYARTQLPYLEAAKNRISSAVTLLRLPTQEYLASLSPDEHPEARKHETVVRTQIYRDDKLRQRMVRDLEFAASSSLNLIPYLHPRGALIKVLESINLNILFDQDQNRLRDWLLHLVMNSYIPFSSEERQGHETLLHTCNLIRSYAVRHLQKSDFSKASPQILRDFWSFMLSPPQYFNQRRAYPDAPLTAFENQSAIEQIADLDLSLAPLYRKYFQSVTLTQSQQSQFLNQILARAQWLAGQQLYTSYISIFKMTSRMNLDSAMYRQLWLTVERDHMLAPVLAQASGFIRGAIKQGIAKVTIEEYSEWQALTLRSYESLLTRPSTQPSTKSLLFKRMLADPEFLGRSYLGLYETLSALVKNITEAKDLKPSKQAMRDIDLSLERALTNDPTLLWHRKLNRVRNQFIFDWSAKYRELNHEAPPADAIKTDCWRYLTLHPLAIRKWVA